MTTHKIFNLAIAFVFAFSLLGMPAPVLAQVSNPTFAAHLPGNQVHAYNWTAGSTLTLTIDDPEISGSPDFQGAEVVPDNDLYGNTWTVFELPDFELKPGQALTITDNITTKTHVIRTVAVASVSPNTDVITGTAEPNTEVGINAHYNPGGDYVHRNIVTDANGNWTVNLSILGPNPDEERTYDIVTGSWGTAFQWDEDNDSTFYGWRVLNSYIHAGPNQGFVYAHDWPEGAVIHMTVARAGSTIYTSDATVGPCGSGNPGSGPCGPNDAYFDLGYFDSAITRFDLLLGDVITLTDGGITRSMIVSALQVTDINTNTDTLTGMADIGSDVNVGVCNGPSLMVTPDSSGHWIANFAPFDIAPGTCGGATQDDGNGNYTQQGWVMDNPNFNVRVNNDQVEARATNNQVYFSQWRIGDTLTLSIDNPITAKNPDYTATQTVTDVAPWDPSQTYVLFNLSGVYDIQTGDTVSVSNGILTKTTVVTNLAITDVHLDTDIIEGTAEPDQTINVWTCWQSDPCVNRDETADQNGRWTTNFAVPGEQDWEQETADLRAGSWIDSSVNDEDGDSTMFGWYVPDQLPFAPFVVFGQEGVWLKENTDVVSGDVAANIASERPYLTDQSEVTIGQDVRFMDPASRVMGDTVYLKQGSQVYDVYANELKGRGQILGANHTPLELPLVPQLPVAPDVNPGTQNFDLKKNSTLTLDAGSYGKLETKKGAVITFTGGVYHFSEWSLGDDAKIYFAAPTEIRIAGKLDIGSDAFIGPATGANLTARDILIYVMGENGKNGKINASPKAANFGMRSTLIANVYTPNGTLWIHERSTATGAFFGKWVEIGQNVTLTLDNGWH